MAGAQSAAMLWTDYQSHDVRKVGESMLRQSPALPEASAVNLGQEPALRSAANTSKRGKGRLLPPRKRGPAVLGINTSCGAGE